MREPLVYILSTSNPPTPSALLSSLPDTQTLEQSAQEYTTECVGKFLETIGLGHHVATFIEKDISGDMLLGDIEEMLEELGVINAAEKFKIKVYIYMGGVDEKCLAKENHLRQFQHHIATALSAQFCSNYQLFASYLPHNSKHIFIFSCGNSSKAFRKDGELFMVNF